MILNLKSRLDKGILICDGAMGTYLNQKGISYEHCLDELCISKPEIIAEVHREYIDAGAEMIETNSFGANRFRLASHGYENLVRDINIKAVKIAREAREVSGMDILIAGSIGPLGKPLEPLGKIKIGEARNAFIEQGGALLEGGIDLFIIETISSIDEMTIAVEAIKSISDLPIVAQMSYTTEGTTFYGNTPAEIADRLSHLDIDVIGANCSVGPQKMLEVVEQLAKEGVRYISAQPNAGMPKYFEGRFIYLTSADYFAQCATSFVKAGARLIGGCCGTRPEHIAAIVSAVKGASVDQSSSSSVVKHHRKHKELDIAGGVQTKFYEKLKNDFVISVEIDPPKGSNPSKMIQAASDLKAAGADAVNIADSPMARVRMSCQALAYLISSSVDIDIVLHFTARDRNLMGLQADLIGAHAIGIRNILALTGDPPSVGDYPQATAVYDVDSIGLVKIISRLNSGVDAAGNSIGKPTSFSIGVAANPASSDFDNEIKRLQAKIDAGGQYIMTQPLYEIDILKRFMDALKPDIPVMLGILPLVNFKHAQYLHFEVPGIDIPVPIRQAMEKAGEKSALVGREVAQEYIEQARNLVSGIYLMPSFGRFETCIEIIKEIKS